jgi:hypothetical protein
MERLFQIDQAEWKALALDAEEIQLSAMPDQAVLVRKIDNEKSLCSLLVAPGVVAHVNGEKVLLGARVLNDRDAIHLAGQGRMFYSAHSAPVVAPYSGKVTIPCSRCRIDIRPGELAVQCPGCHLFFHQSQESPCWLHAEQCVCEHPTALEDDNSWSPNEI